MFISCTHVFIYIYGCLNWYPIATILCKFFRLKVLVTKRHCVLVVVVAGEEVVVVIVTSAPFQYRWNVIQGVTLRFKEKREGLTTIAQPTQTPCIEIENTSVVCIFGELIR